MLDPRITTRADRSALAVARITKPVDPGYHGALAVIGHQIMSAQRREGTLLCDAIQAVFQYSARYIVLRNVHIAISHAVRTVAAARFAEPRTEMRRCPAGRGIRVDLVVLDTWTNVVYFLELKRGVKGIGADHRARLEDNWRALELIARDVAAHLFQRTVTDVITCVISYYGNTNFRENQTLTRDTLDAFFDLPIRETVDAHLAYFRFRLDTHVPGLTGYTGGAGFATPAPGA